jgi:hypothetical protein
VVVVVSLDALIAAAALVVGVAPAAVLHPVKPARHTIVSGSIPERKQPDDLVGRGLDTRSAMG